MYLSVQVAEQDVKDRVFCYTRSTLRWEKKLFWDYYSIVTLEESEALRNTLH